VTCEQPGRPVLVDDRIGEHVAGGTARRCRRVARAASRSGSQGNATPARCDDQKTRIDKGPDCGDLDDAGGLRRGKAVGSVALAAPAAPIPAAPPPITTIRCRTSTLLI
jgi:hypothetical protein